MASESAFSVERLVAARIGEQTDVGPWQIRLAAIDPVAGPNWTALQADLQASYRGGDPLSLEPQSRSFAVALRTANAVPARMPQHPQSARVSPAP